MRASVVPLFLLGLLCALSACGSQNDRAQEQDGLAKSLRTSAPVLAAQDALLAAEVKSKLIGVDVDSASLISVRVRNGEVVLRGEVRKNEEIGRLSDAAASVRGVTSVETLLEVNPKMRGTSEKFSDVSLATEVAVNLAAQTGINALSIKTHAVDGVVTIEGRVRSAALKSVMVSAATNTHGVKKLIDKIEVAKK